jgi:hypothetical protein
MSEKVDSEFYHKYIAHHRFMSKNRTCESCTVCCNIYAIPEINKTEYEHCKHCDVGKGCNIQEAKPKQCSQYYCGWRIFSYLDQSMKPSKSGLVLHVEPIEETKGLLLKWKATRDGEKIWKTPECQKAIAALHSVVAEETRGFVITAIAERNASYVLESSLLPYVRFTKAKNQKSLMFQPTKDSLFIEVPPHRIKDL